MRATKKAAVLALAMGLAVTGNMTALAAAEAPAVKTTGGVDSNGKADSTLTGTVNITSIKVEVPIAATFDIDPNIAVTAGAEVKTDTVTPANTTNQITGPTNYTIKNKSKAPLVVSITGITTKDKDGGDTADAPTLVNKMNSLTGKNVLFAVRANGETISYPEADGDASKKWMMKDTISPAAPYYVKGTTAADNVLLADDGAAGGNDELTMTLYGATGDGWKNGNKFQIIPTFTIALQE